MRVGFVYRGDPRRVAANRVSAFKNVAAIAHLGHDATLFIPRHGMSKRRAIHEAERARVSLAIDETFRVAPMRDHVLAGRGKRVFDLTTALRARLRSLDLLWSREVRAADYATAMGLPTILEHHHPMTATEAHILRRVRARDSFRGVAAVSGVHKGILVDAGVPAEMVVVAHSGVDLDLFGGASPETGGRSEDGPEERPRVVYAGSLYSGRGCEEIVEAAQRLGDAHFVIAGGRDFEIARLEASAGRDGHDNLTFTGPIAHAELPRLLRSADVLLAPYRADCLDIAGRATISYASPIKLFEYMAAGRAIVASNIGAIPEIIRHGVNGLLIRPGSVDDLVAGIDRLLAHPDLARRLGMKAFEDVETYTWKLRVAKVIEFSGSK